MRGIQDMAFTFGDHESGTLASCEVVGYACYDSYEEFMISIEFEDKSLNPPSGCFYTSQHTSWFTDPADVAVNAAKREAEELWAHLTSSDAGAVKLLREIDRLNDLLQATINAALARP
jgi:hypothetical protein